MFHFNDFSFLQNVNLLSQCISDNVERCNFVQNCVPDCQKGVLDCKNARVGNRDCSIYVLHSHFGNPKRLLWQSRIFFIYLFFFILFIYYLFIYLIFFYFD